MQVFLDQEPFHIEVPTPATLGEWTALANQQARGQNRVVVEIGCDGQRIAEDQLEQALAYEVNRIQRLEFNTCHTTTLVSSAFGQAVELLGRMGESQASAADLFNQGNNQQAIDLLQSAFSGWDQVQQAVAKSSQLLNWSLDDMQVQDQPVTEVLDQLAYLLREVRQSLENQDYVLLADLLQYEFGPLTTRWQEMLEGLRNIAQESPAPTT
jgi:hypothetical protein